MTAKPAANSPRPSPSGESALDQEVAIRMFQESVVLFEESVRLGLAGLGHPSPGGATHHTPAPELTSYERTILDAKRLEARHGRVKWTEDLPRFFNDPHDTRTTKHKAHEENHDR